MRIPGSIGRYIPVDSPVHRLDTVAKMIFVAMFTIAVFLVESFTGLVAVSVLVAFVIRSARVPFGQALRGMRAITVILFFTVLAHTIAWGEPPIGALVLGPMHATLSGLETGGFFAVRIALLVVGASLLSLTTSPVGLTDGIERLLRPLGRLGVPVHDIAMILSIALRFIPTTVEEADRIVMAQRARGARFDKGGPVARARAYLPVMLPLFVSLFRRADSLALAMDARCYRGGEGRTRTYRGSMGLKDWVTLVGGVAVLVVVVVLF